MPSVAHTIFCQHSDHGLWRPWMYVCVHNHTHIYIRLCKGVCNPLSILCSAYCTGIILLPSTCAMLLEKKVFKTWNQQSQSQFMIYAVPEGQPSIFEGNLRGIPASICEAWSSYSDLQDLKNLWKHRFSIASLFSRISNSVPTLWLQVPLVQVRPQPSDPCDGAPSLSHMGKSTSAPSALIQVA